MPVLTRTRELLEEHGIICRMSRKGNCYDNAMMESCHGTLKTELVYVSSRKDDFNYN